MLWELLDHEASHPLWEDYPFGIIVGMQGNQAIPSLVKYNAIGDHHCFKPYRSDVPHLMVLRAISSRKAQGIFQSMS